MHDQPGVLDFILACVGGAIVSAIRTTGISLWEKFGVGVVGFLVAYYVGRFVYAYYDMPPEYLAPVGFVIGMVGKASFVRSILFGLKAINSFMEQRPTKFLSVPERRLGLTYLTRTGFSYYSAINLIRRLRWRLVILIKHYNKADVSITRPSCNGITAW